jgi:L-ascorbate metabolism protein UlaG (beta-lactamase superfamily)
VPARKTAPWLERNFVTEVLLPSLLVKRSGRKHNPVFPKLKRGQIAITWIGHASFLVQTQHHNIVIDPNWANWLGVIRRLKTAGFALRHLPDVDLVLVTHAHFDHLNKRSLRQIADRQPIVVPRGVRPLVEDLGFHTVHEMEWWDSCRFDGVEIVFTPAKHWGARVLRERGFGGFIIRYEGRSVYHVGDSAYFDGFKEIGKRLRPEIVLMPIGAYEPPSGRDVHISPEQAMHAFEDLRAKMLIPMHFGTYRLSFEPIHEPLERLMAAAARHGVLPHVHVLTEGLPEVF